jgi:CHAD domain-containing protein
MAKAKEVVGLDCEASVESGAILVLRERMEEVCQLRAAALDWSDVEGVHDMRVASRRLRSSLRDFMPYLRQGKLRRANDYLKAIADALGDVRDEDVAIMALEELSKEAPEEVAAGVERLAAERAAHREGARAELQDAISEGVLARLQGEFTFALEHATKTGRRKRNAKQDKAQAGASATFRQAGRDIIAAGFEEMQKLSTSLHQPHGEKRLHRMRIAAKRLRYAVELFAHCWGEPLVPFAEEIAEMQGHLGELHDCDVWIATLGARLRHARSSKASSGGGGPEHENSAQDRRAAAWLLSQFVKDRTKHYRAALKRWHEWEARDFAANLMASLNAEHESIEIAPLTLSPAEAVASDLQNA